MYVQRRDSDKGIMSKEEFNRSAKEATTREVASYKERYGRELKGYVWKQTLNRLHCVIHPYFKHLDENTRIGSLDTIKQRLEACFTNGNKGLGFVFEPEDQGWRHIGHFNNLLYLFDLGDLRRTTDTEAIEEFNLHIQQLR